MTGFRLADIIEPLGGDRSWYEQAKCRKLPPGEYDSIDQDGVKGFHKAYRIIQVMEKCEGCPVVQQCAQQAVEQRWTGVIAAGVELPAYHWYQKGFRPHHRAAMDAMADGEPLHRAIAGYMANGQADWIVSLVALLRERYIEITGRIPAPTPKTTVMPPQALARARGESKTEVERIRQRYLKVPKEDIYASVAEDIMRLPAAVPPGEDYPEWRGAHE